MQSSGLPKSSTTRLPFQRPRFSFGDPPAAASAKKNTASSNSGAQLTDEADIQNQLADARKEAQNALAEWRSYPNPYYELTWAEAVAKVQRLEARIPKRKTTSGGA